MLLIQSPALNVSLLGRAQMQPSKWLVSGIRRLPTSLAAQLPWQSGAAGVFPRKRRTLAVAPVIYHAKSLTALSYSPPCTGDTAGTPHGGVSKHCLNSDLNLPCEHLRY